MQTERFFKPEGKSLQNALEFTRSGTSGAEIYSFLSLNKNNLPEGVIWCSEKEGKTSCVIYKNGDMTVTKAENANPYPGLHIMKFSSFSPEGYDETLPLTHRDALRAYEIMNGGKKLSPANEERYVYRARLMRDGFSYGFGIKKENELVSFAFITASNEDSCIIGDVFTVPEHRNLGYAKSCTLSAAKKCLEMNKSAYILCKEEMKEFYRKMGFCSL
ncbi:MAG: GNAT family N-acetyltransferase [Oscillospiraceae bacterium]|nr:GNAT family N-acetyltransferase [Oscillospiraceae bacterium]